VQFLTPAILCATTYEAYVAAAFLVGKIQKYQVYFYLQFQPLFQKIPYCNQPKNHVLLSDVKLFT
jgi:hypothetical protein